MFWSTILPFQITTALWAVIIAVVTYFAPKFGKKRFSIALSCIGLGFLLFIPSCAIIQTIAAPFRFGIFHYPNYAAINDWRVERYLPSLAADITLEKPKHTNGFRAKFKITKPELEGWFNESWNRGKAYSVISREESQDVSASPDFSDLGWPPLTDAIQYVGPTKGNGAGYIIWYSESQGVAYEDAGYW
jgi:hypothetical protein